MRGIHKKVRLSDFSKKPFDRDLDVRGDIAFFIPDGTKMSNKDLIAELRWIYPLSGSEVFFRLIDAQGNQLHTHGWIRYNPKTGLAEVTQYG